MNDYFDNKTEKAEGFSIDISSADEFSEVVAEKPKKSFTKEVIEWLEIFVVAIVAVIVIFTLFFRIATIDGPSMNNTLLNGQKVIISNFNYTPKQGDIIVISRNIENSVEAKSSADTPIIKRVIATGGQTVNIDFSTGTVYVDDVPLKENYISSPTTNSYDVEFPKYVPEGYVFVLGDNRRVSLDSRSSQIGEDGLVDERYILGKAYYRILPFDAAGGLY